MNTQPNSIQYRLLLGNEAEKRAALGELIKQEGKKFYKFFANTRLFYFFYPKFYLLLLGKVLTKEEIEDLLSFSYTRMLEQLVGIYSFKSHGTITLYHKLINTKQIKNYEDFDCFQYLIDIAKNELRNLQKKKKSQGTSPFSQQHSDEDDKKNTILNQESLGDKRDRGRYSMSIDETSLIFDDLAAKCMSKQKERCKEIFRLKEEGYTTQEIAEMLGQTPNGLKSTHSVCRKEYKSCLEKLNYKD